ncbi:hypothetical protein CVT25_015001 [Psilocybe cyanescens]|uniref:Uncharacterized protein n=1 Tax=Psilocybe cyanescens TaxID=93625 RepID=A0A409XAC6_PSICY|nr:hypothetical protein CVT25_015001 [Psilocybe cyanescens]
MAGVELVTTEAEGDVAEMEGTGNVAASEMAADEGTKWLCHRQRQGRYCWYLHRWLAPSTWRSDTYMGALAMNKRDGGW